MFLSREINKKLCLYVIIFSIISIKMQNKKNKAPVGYRRFQIDCV